MALSTGFRRSRIATTVVAAAAALTMLVACGSTAGDDAGPAADSTTQVTTSDVDGSTSSSPDADGPTSSTPGTDTDTDAAAGSGTSTAAADGGTTGSDPDGGTTSNGSSDDPATATSSSGGDAAPASFPVTITTSTGELTISTQPTAIVSLSPTATEMLYAVGAGSQVVAVDKNSDYPKGLPDARVDAYQLNVETVSTFHPDLVVSAALTDDQVAKFDALKIPVLQEPAVADLAGTYEQIQQIGLATGHADAAQTLVTSMKQKVTDIVAKAPTFDPQATYYYELDETFYSQTSDTFLGSLLKTLHLTNIADGAKGAAESGGYPQLSAEFILKQDPDYIFLADGSCCQVTPDSVAKRPGWSGLQAVQGHRVIELDSDIASRWGPRVPQLLDAVVTALTEHPATR